ncbi:MAG: RNA 2',3'-cyclic phosphodiesterase [Candidatus Omnitrophica bacterium]|nr:RNA 2',3'-cyclic phosphodiesterase [Candidatus Omnitrophota bacterium]
MRNHKLTIRSFIALDIPDKVKNELSLLVSTLEKTGADVKWVKKENFHLTLKFLGQITEEQVNHVKRILEKISQKQRRFSFHLSGLGSFPDLRRPRVLWVGIDRGVEMLEVLTEKIESEIAQTGIKGENRLFSPHLTLGRVRSPRNLQKLVTCMEQVDFSSSEEIFPEHVSLYKSILSPKGSVYEVIAESQIPQDTS